MAGKKADTNPNESIGDESCPSDNEGGCYIGEVYIPPPPPTIKKFKTKGQPRLHIQSIEITNFKSYAGTQVLGPFCKSFNAIIGPNGSGKSNVIDAMLFVFGSKSSRIRCTKSDQLVHNSEGARNSESCTVSVQFVEIVDHGGNDFTTVPDSEFRITRTLYKSHNDATSYYFINDQRVGFKDVTKLLKKHGVDLVNHRFLILQGQVEAISQMPCKGRTPRETGLLEYLEEIIGTNRYNGPLTQLRQLIDHNEKEKEQRLERVKSVKTSVEALAGDLEKCVAYFKKENAVRSMEHQIAQSRLARLQEIANATLRKKQEVEKQVEERRERVEEVSSSVAVKQEDVQQMEGELNHVTQSVVNLEGAVRENHNKITKYEAAIKENQKKMSRYKCEFQKEQEGEKTARELPAAARPQITKLEAEIVRLEEKKKEEEKRLVATVATIADATRDAKEKKDALQAQQIELRRKYNEAKSEYDLAHSELTVYTSTEVEHKNKLEKLRVALEETSTRYEDSKERQVELQARLPQLETQHKARSAELQRICQREVQGNSDLRKYQTEAADIKDRMETSSSSNQLIDFVMKLKMSGAVSGILGRLGDLGAIDEKYDVAVSTACGALDYIVVETVEAGQAVLAEVKRANKGRVNVMALNQMGHYLDKCHHPASNIGGLTRLFDLIRVEDERVKPAMYYATGATLVAETLELAMRVGYSKQARVVTLEGAIIDPSGTMSGGGRTLIRGKMGRSVQVCTDPESTVQNLKKISRKMDNLEKELANLRSSKSTLEMTVAQLRAEITNSQQELQKLNIDIPSLESNIPTLEMQIKLVESELKKVVCDPKQVKKLNEDLKKKKAVMEKCEEQAKKLEEKVAKVHEEIIKISAGKTGAIEKSLHEATRALLKAKSDLNNLNVEMKRADRDVIKCGERGARLFEEMNNLGKMTLDNKEHIQIYNEQIEEMTEELGVKEKELASCKVRMDKILKEMSKLVAWRDKEENLLENVSRELRTIKHTYEDNLVQTRHATGALEKIQLTPVPVLYDLEEVFTKANTFEEASDLCEELPVLSPEDARNLDIESLEAQITRIDNELKFLDFNESRVLEYKQKIRDYVKRAKEMQAVLASLNTYSSGYEQCLAKRQKEFDSNFAKISRRVKECYQMLTFGGEADLEYKEYSDPYAQGIKYVVRPLRKSWKSIDCLSGGEKTLASLALVFALHYYSPSPLYFLDEIDAALDTPNVAIIGQFIRTRTRFAQFIIISLRHEMFELATNLIGIYKTKNCTKSITITKDICKEAPMTEDEALLLDIEISDDEDEDEDEVMTDNSQQGIETEEDTRIQTGAAMQQGAGDDTENDEILTADEDDVMECDNEDNDVDHRARDKPARQKARTRRGRRRQEIDDDSDTEDETNSKQSEGSSRHSEGNDGGSRRLRVRGVKQINAGAGGSHSSSIQAFIRQKPAGTSTPKGAEKKSRGNENQGREGSQEGQRKGIIVRKQLLRPKGRSIAKDTSDEDVNVEDLDTRSNGRSPPTKRRSMPRRKIIPNTEDEDSAMDGGSEGDIYEMETLVDEEVDEIVPPKRGQKSKRMERADSEDEAESLREIFGKRRRGRRTELSQDEEMEENVPKKKRGRQSKQRNEYANVEEYSQDEAELSQDEDIEQEKAPKKRRGRQPKQRTEDINVEEYSQDEAELSQDEDIEQEKAPKKRRGRQPKQRTEDINVEEYSQDEAELSQDEDIEQEKAPKKRRGRQPKQRTEDINVEEYSQDEAELSQDEDIEQEKAPKKRRGRQPKQRTEDINVEEYSQDEAEISQDEDIEQEKAPKKRRGRQPKQRTEDINAEEYSQDEAELSQDEDIEQEKAPKKRRGRQPKQRTEDINVEEYSQDEAELSQDEDIEQEKAPKKRRGRQPKQRTEDINVEEYSQDEAELSQDEDIEQEKAPKKRRGRQPKQRTEDINVEEYSQDEAELSQDEDIEQEKAPKKRRGRQPKQRSEDNVAEYSQDDAESLREIFGKKKHGTTQIKENTAKYSKDEDDLSHDEEIDPDVPPKKRRGRRPKQINEDVGEFSQDELSQDEEIDDPQKKKRGRKPKRKNEHIDEEEFSQDEGGFSQDEDTVLRKAHKKRIGSTSKETSEDINVEDFSQDEGELSQDDETEENPKRKRGRRPK